MSPHRSQLDSQVQAQDRVSGPQRGYQVSHCLIPSGASDCPHTVRPYAPNDPWPGIFAPAEESYVLIHMVQEHICMQQSEDVKVKSRPRLLQNQDATVLLRVGVQWGSYEQCCMHGRGALSQQTACFFFPLMLVIPALAAREVPRSHSIFINFPIFHRFWQHFLKVD